MDDDAIGIVEGQAANKDGVDECEYRGVDADAEPQRQDRDRSEARSFTRSRTANRKSCSKP